MFYFVLYVHRLADLHDGVQDTTGCGGGIRVGCRTKDEEKLSKQIIYCRNLCDIVSDDGASL